MSEQVAALSGLCVCNSGCSAELSGSATLLVSMALGALFGIERRDE